jgi:hypothetical protein
LIGKGEPRFTGLPEHAQTVKIPNSIRTVFEIRGLAQRGRVLYRWCATGLSGWLLNSMTFPASRCATSFTFILGLKPSGM